MTVILVTGMSGVGKSSVLTELARRGHQVVDTDYGGYAEDIDGEQLWRVARIRALLDEHADGLLFLSGTVSNQRAFYPRFEAVVLLSAPVDVLLSRIATRDTNDFGKSDAERDRILADVASVEPLLRAGATVEFDTSQPLAAVANAVESVAVRTHRKCGRGQDATDLDLS